MHSININTLLPLLPVFIASVSAHGYIISPAARQPGPDFGAACGAQALSQQQSDIYGNIQGELQVVGSGFDASKCNLWQCKGFLLSDQPASNVQAFTAGQVVPINFEIRAPHNGVANISIVDTASNTIISELKSWDQYALTSRPSVEAESKFDITIPSDLGSKCATAGDCVIQMFWDARSVDQTYESCIDFTVGGDGSGSGSGSGSGPSSSAAPSASSSAAVSSTRGTSASASSGSVEVTASATTNNNVISSTTAAPVATSAASADTEIFTMTAGDSVLYCKEEL